MSQVRKDIQTLFTMSFLFDLSREIHIFSKQVSSTPNQTVEAIVARMSAILDKLAEKQLIQQDNVFALFVAAYSIAAEQEVETQVQYDGFGLTSTKTITAQEIQSNVERIKQDIDITALSPLSLDSTKNLRNLQEKFSQFDYSTLLTLTDQLDLLNDEFPNGDVAQRGKYAAIYKEILEDAVNSNAFCNQETLDAVLSCIDASEILTSREKEVFALSCFHSFETRNHREKNFAQLLSRLESLTTSYKTLDNQAPSFSSFFSTRNGKQNLFTHFSDTCKQLHQECSPLSDAEKNTLDAIVAQHPRAALLKQVLNETYSVTKKL